VTSQYDVLKGQFSGSCDQLRPVDIVHKTTHQLGKRAKFKVKFLNSFVHCVVLFYSAYFQIVHNVA